MASENNWEQERLDAIREGAENIRRLNLMSDTFASVALEDKDACQYVIRKILGTDDINIVEVKGQYRLLNLTAKDAILDALAEDNTGKLINIEIQRRDTVDHARRTRYYGSMIDKSVLDKGAEHEDLPDVYIIYISETDLWKIGETIYRVEKTIGQSKIPYDDGRHVIFVNASVNDGSAVAQMMQYFKSADPNDMSQGDLSKRVRFLKSEKGGYEEMCNVAEEIYQKGIKQGIETGIEKGIEKGIKQGIEKGLAKGIAQGEIAKSKQAALNLHKLNMPVEQIAAVLSVSITQVNEWLSLQAT